MVMLTLLQRWHVDLWIWPQSQTHPFAGSNESAPLTRFHSTCSGWIFDFQLSIFSLFSIFRWRCGSRIEEWNGRESKEPRWQKTRLLVNWNRWLSLLRPVSQKKKENNWKIHPDWPNGLGSFLYFVVTTTFVLQSVVTTVHPPLQKICGEHFPRSIFLSSGELITGSHFISEDLTGLAKSVRPRARAATAIGERTPKCCCSGRTLLLKLNDLPLCLNS